MALENGVRIEFSERDALRNCQSLLTPSCRMICLFFVEVELMSEGKPPPRWAAFNREDAKVDGRVDPVAIRCWGGLGDTRCGCGGKRSKAAAIPQKQAREERPEVVWDRTSRERRGCPRRAADRSSAISELQSHGYVVISIYSIVVRGCHDASRRIHLLFASQDRVVGREEKSSAQERAVNLEK